jgi:hypothetical protein
MFNWSPGRQGTGYRKLCLWEFKKFDCWVIDYPIGSSAPSHTDPCTLGRHYRFNILLSGKDNFTGKTIYSSNRIKFFRPDINIHSVNETDCRRVVLSFGFILS